MKLRTKIIATIGPSSGEARILERMIRAGMTVARFNFAHGDRGDFASWAQTIRRLSKKLGVPVAILQDLQGPKLRVGKLPEAGLLLEAGERLILTSRGTAKKGEIKRIPIQLTTLAGDVRADDRILLDDGRLELVVIKTEGAEIEARVVCGGILKSAKGMNLPDSEVSVPALTAKDRDDLAFGAHLGVDFVGLSFVRRAADIRQLRRLLHQAGSQAKIVAKIEKHEAIGAIDEIVGEADAIMVARGDLGLELPAEDVPLLQKKLITKALLARKPIIVATQMLESMVTNPRPTRAEVSDVANAVFDSADALMLSAETATGDYPVEAVAMMATIIGKAERSLLAGKRPTIPQAHDDVTEAISAAARQMADDLGARLILCATMSGFTARAVAKQRPAVPIVAVTAREVVQRQLTLSWGISPYLVAFSTDIDTLISEAIAFVRHSALVGRGDRIIITAGHPIGIPGTTNLLKVHTV